MYEHRKTPLLPARAFAQRLAKSALVFCIFVGLSLTLGTLGYHQLGGLTWVDSLLNASMILTGMGPVDRMEGRLAKLFASAYALYSGVAFLTSVGVLLAPVVHRLMHRFHLEAERD